MRSEVLTEMPMLVFWVAMPCGFVDKYQCFRETNYLHLQGRRCIIYRETAHSVKD
jgi:hypothetical protein